MRIGVVNWHRELGEAIPSDGVRCNDSRLRCPACIERSRSIDKRDQGRWELKHDVLPQQLPVRAGLLL